ncbi:unnamed protein product [Cuscuta epithymum]|uniref:Uncharacterized protein n=1 Tax=Cuscuta epithymum TaxID=186058 RepID=A0AAV0EXF0_9ASTE|nr:unnamed protein product [Cuscuta epithymum]
MRSLPPLPSRSHRRRCPVEAIAAAAQSKPSPLLPSQIHHRRRPVRSAAAAAAKSAVVEIFFSSSKICNNRGQICNGGAGLVATVVGSTIAVAGGRCRLDLTRSPAVSSRSAAATIISTTAVTSGDRR